MVMVFATTPGRARPADACGKNPDTVYNTAVGQQSRSAVFLSGFLPDRSLVRLQVLETLDDADELVFAAGHIADPTGYDEWARQTPKVPASLSEEDPRAPQLLDVRSVTTDDRGRTIVSFELEPSKNLLWQSQRFFVVGCSDGALKVSTILEERVSHRRVSLGLAIVFTAALYLAVLLATKESRAARGLGRGPIALTVGFKGQGSLSRLQILFFTLIVAFLLAYIWLRTGLLSGLSNDVLLLMGIVGGGAAGAQATAITRNSLSLENRAWLENRGWKDRENVKAKLRDIISSGGTFDVYKFQMFAFSLIVGLSLVFTGRANLAEFEIPDTLLGVLGLSNVVYIGGKAVGPATFDEINKALDALRKLEREIAAKVIASLAPDKWTSFDEVAKTTPTEYASYREASREVSMMVSSKLGGEQQPDIGQPTIR